jgi:hypothetical protein
MLLLAQVAVERVGGDDRGEDLEEHTGSLLYRRRFAAATSKSPACA